jgi:lipoate-protein ligase A
MKNFRMIPFQYFNAYTNMALDEAIMEGVRNGISQPTIRFYGWEPSAVSIGVFQGVKNEVNLETTKKDGVDVVRRLTGGGAVYHDKFGEVTYSLIAPLDFFPTNIIESYRVICDDIVFALQQLGIHATFAPINDILVNEQKISGNAQTRRNGILLQHGTILYSVDVETMFSLLNVSDQKISDKLIKSVQKRVTSIKDQTGASMNALKDALIQGFQRNRNVDFGDYSDIEKQRAQELVDERFNNDSWTFRL